jgi:hypothetical protein
VKEKTSLTGLNCHAQEVVKITQILHRKLLLWTRGSQNNVINVEEEIGNPNSMVYTNNKVSDLASTNPVPAKKSTMPEVTHPAIQIRTTGIHKTRWLAAVDCLGQSAMEKCILDTELVHRPRAREPERGQCAL